MATPDLCTPIHKCILLDDDDDDESMVDSPSCDGCECMDTGTCVVPYGVGSQQPLQTTPTAAAAAAAVAAAATVKNHGQQSPSKLVPKVDLGGPSTSAFNMGKLGEPGPSSREHSYELRSRIPRPPNAFMLFAQEKRRLVAAQNPNENNQIVSTRLGKMWRALSTADKEFYCRRAAVEAAEHRKKFPGYVYNPRDARRRKEQERRAKQIAAKLKKGAAPPPAVTAKERSGTSSHELGSAKRRLTMQRRRRRAAAGGMTRTRGATASAPRTTRAPRQTTAAPRRTAFVQAMASSSRTSAALDEQRRHAAQSVQQRDSTNGSNAPQVPQFPAAATHPCDARMPLVACGRDCAAVPCHQMEGPSTSRMVGGGTQPQGWFTDAAHAPTAPQMAAGLAPTSVLWLPLLTTAAAPAVAPSLSLLLPGAMAVPQAPAAVARPPQPFDAQAPHHAQARHDAAAASMNSVGPPLQGHQAPTQTVHPTQHDPHSAGAATNPSNGGAFAPIPGVAGHPHTTAMSHTAATAAGTSSSMMWSPPAGQPAQRDALPQQGAYQRPNAAAPTFSHDAAAVAATAVSTHGYYGAAAPQPVYHHAQMALTGVDAHPFGPLLSATPGGHAGGAIFLSPTALFSPVFAANQPHPMAAVNQYPAGFLRQQPGLLMGSEQSPHSPLGADWSHQAGSWGGSFASDEDFGVHPVLGRPNGQQLPFGHNP